MERNFRNEDNATIFAGDLSSRTVADEFVELDSDRDASGDDGYDLHHAGIPSIEPTSYLPSWVLKMREKIATSRTAHADAEQRISQLHMDVDSLSAKLLVMRPVPVALKVSKSGINGKSVKTEKKVERAYIYSLPSELLTVVLEYLQIRQIVRMDLVSRTFRNMISQCTYWSDAFCLYCPHLHVADPLRTSSELRCAQMKSAMLQYLRNVKICTDFIQTMKDQRSVPKHRSVQPHRHTRQERQVTHPMPVFEQQQSHTPQAGAQGGVLQGSFWGQRADNVLRSADRIMSHAETLSSDFRSVAHRALDTLSLLTSDCQDPVIYKLVSDGAITVLTALLLNEEGAIQNYACVVIANLLAWEARKRALFRQQQRHRTASSSAVKPSFSLAAVDAQTLLTLEALFGLSARAAAQLVPLAAQVQACGGFKMMTSLLTSPTASINLASSSISVYRGKGDGSSAGGESVGSVKISTTSNIQGMCNKQASRALLALLYPEMPIPAPAALLQRAKVSAKNKDVFHMRDEAKIDEGKAAKDDSKSDSKALSPAHVWRADAKNIIGAHLSPSVSPNKTKLAPLSHAASPVKGLPSTPSVPPLLLSPASAGADLVPEQLRAPMVSLLFLSDTTARPWLFSYFYKSGAVKDQFTCYLRFVPLHAGAHSTSTSDSKASSDDSALALTGAELRGRGIDSIGAFALAGRAEADISGWTWYFHKSYVPTTFGTNSASGEGDSALDWVRNVDDDVYSINAGGSCSTRGNTVHVSHVAYWSAGVDAQSPQPKTSSVSRSGAKADLKADADVGAAPSTAFAAAGPTADQLDFIDEEPSGVWGMGLWGVWETSSGTTPHFELQKGGVFRAAPIIL